ncbi:MAG: DNA photolyase family protein [Cyanobacteria bacterium REEB67]|nr:DNA photolyase family protein [Cyanobacteria bacterium REEB67]
MTEERVNSTAHVSPTIVWLRQDLRLADQPALHKAWERGAPIIPVYMWAPEEEGEWAPGGATKVWLHQSLARLSADLAELDSRLFIFDCSQKKSAGPVSSLAVLSAVARATGAGAVYWNRRYEPAIIERDKAIKSHLKGEGVTVETFNGALLVEPWEIATKEGRPYQVFTPFWRTLQSQYKPETPLSRPGKLTLPAELIKKIEDLPDSKKSRRPVTLDDLHLLPEIHWDGGIKESWEPGEAGALKQLKKFRSQTLASYKDDRNMPELEGVSRMSPHLHFGEISPRTIWHEVTTDLAASGTRPNSKIAENGASYLREIGWREFSHHLLFHFPHTTDEPLRQQFDHFPWARDKKGFEAWTKGLTGYPIVDAGMRELWHTGIMHNRVRMIAASFLIKDLLIPWQDGAHWFWDTLVDADLAQNTMGWQWTAGCGADAAPYYRIFNPVLQGEKFDPKGAYVRKWVPELKKLSPKWIHKPWLAPPLELAAAGITLGENYPAPLVDHSEARDRALAAFKKVKGVKSPEDAHESDDQEDGDD